MDQKLCCSAAGNSSLRTQKYPGKEQLANLGEELKHVSEEAPVQATITATRLRRQSVPLLTRSRRFSSSCLKCRKSLPSTATRCSSLPTAPSSWTSRCSSNKRAHSPPNDFKPAPAPQPRRVFLRELLFLQSIPASSRPHPDSSDQGPPHFYTIVQNLIGEERDTITRTPSSSSSSYPTSKISDGRDTARVHRGWPAGRCP